MIIKRKSLFFRKFAPLKWWALGCGLLFSQTPKGVNPEIYVGLVRGEIQYRAQGTPKWEPLNIFGFYPCGGYETGESGQVKIFFSDGTSVHFGPSSRFEVKCYSGGTGISQFVNVLQGVALLESEPTKPGAEKFVGDVNFPMGVLKRRRGTYIIDVGIAGERTDVFAVRGLGEVFEAKKGRQFYVKQGELITLHSNSMVVTGRSYSEEHLPEVYPWVEKNWFEEQKVAGMYQILETKTAIQGQQKKILLIVYFIKNTDLRSKLFMATEKPGQNPQNEDWNSNELFVFFERLKNTSSIKRFGTLPMIQFESVASHSYNVAILAILIADFENSPEIHMDSLLKKALFHDFEESILSDIPHSIKHRYKDGQLAKLLKGIVPDLIKNEIFKELPDEMRDHYSDLSVNAKEGIEGKIIEAADAMDTLVTSIRELKLGNRYFQKVFDAAYSLAEKHCDLKFVKIFLQKAKEYNSDKAAFTEQI